MCLFYFVQIYFHCIQLSKCFAAWIFRFYYIYLPIIGLINKQGGKCMKKTALKISALTLAACMMVATVGCGTNGSGKTNSTATSSEQPTTSPRETVKISLCVGSGGYQTFKTTGVQTDPVSLEIEKRTGIQIVINRIPQSDYQQQLATMLATNDLDDICYMGDDNKNITAAIEGDLIIPMDDLLAENAPFISSDPAWTASLEFTKEAFGGIYALKGPATDINSLPTTGNNIRWDLYKKLGYPEINSDDDLLNVLLAMQELEPETKDGQKVYGLGGWFSEGVGWGEWIFAGGYACHNGYTPLKNNMMAYMNFKDRDMYPNNAVTDVNSPFFRGVNFVSKAYRMGLLDPESITQTYAKWEEKLLAGRYLLFQAGWELDATKAAYNTAGTPEKGYVALPTYASDDKSGMAMAWLQYAGVGGYAIAKSCKYPDRALQLLDFFKTPEALGGGARIASSGIEGQGWETVDGKVQLTVEMEKTILEKGLFDAEVIQNTGYDKYRKIGGDPRDGSKNMLTMDGYYLTKTASTVEKDAIAHYAVSSLYDLYTTKSPTVIYECDYEGIMPSMSAELQTVDSTITDFILKNIYKVILTKSEDEYNAAQAEFIEDVSKLKIDEVFNFYKTEFTKAKERMDPMINDAINVLPYK